MNTKSYFGKFGGQYVPETAMFALNELESKYLKAKADPTFQEELNDLLKNYVGRPTPLYHAKNLSAHYGQQIYLKREDLNHTGAHKINNALGQVLLAKRMGKKKSDCRNWCRTTRGGNRYCGGSLRIGMRCVYGCSRYGAPKAKCFPYGTLGRTGSSHSRRT